MKSFWQAVAKYAVKVALYAADHPDQVISLVQSIQAAKAPPK